MTTSTAPAGAIIPTGPNGLLPHHYAALRARGLTDKTIVLAGLTSETDPAKIGSLLGWPHAAKKLGPCIVIPFPGTIGYCQVRPDVPRLDKNKKPIKYECPKGPRPVYFAPGVADVLDNTAQELAITESPFKALALNQELIPAVGLIGVGGWKEKQRHRMLPELERVKWPTRRVYFVPDSDVATNPNVETSVAWACKHLTDRGGIVRMVKLPDAPDGSKMGADDFLAAHGKAAMRKLLDEAGEPPAVAPDSEKKNAEVADPAEEATAFLERFKKGESLRLRHHRGEFSHWSAGRYEIVSKDEVRAELIEQHLNQAFYGVKQSHASNIMEQVRAKVMLPGRHNPPFWVGKSESPWNPEACIVAKNGVVNLAKFTARESDYLSPATPDFFTFNALDYDFNEKAPPPEKWLAFLAQLWPDDKQSIDTAQEWAGYNLVHWTSLQKMLGVFGPRRAGKGVFARVLRAVIGESNVASPTLSSLSAEYGLWALLDKSSAFITDARLSGRTDSAIVVERLLNISGEDSIDIPRKYLETLKSVKLPTRITMFSNELPGLNDSSGALSGRLLLLRLRESFYGRENPRLTDELLAERQGILLWAIEGWLRLRERGRFIQPDSARELVDQMEELASPVAMFVKDCCEIDAAASVSVSTMFNAWKWWCEQHGREPSTSQYFGRNLTAAISSIKRVQPRDGGTRYRAYEGIGLTDEVWAEVSRSSPGSTDLERIGTRDF